VGPLAALAWSRAARLAAVCGASYGCINGVVARTVMAPAEALVAMLVFGAIAFLIFWPLLALGFYCAWRWVGVEPLPLLYDPAARPPAWRLALVVFVAIVLMFVASIVSVLMFPQITEMKGPIDTYAKLDVVSQLVVAGTGVWEEGLFRLALLFPLAAAFGVRASGRDKVPPGLVAAWLVTGTLFALAHLGNVDNGGTIYLLWNLVHKGLMVSGILTAVAWRFGVEAAILAHVGFDAIALVAS